MENIANSIPAHPGAIIRRDCMAPTGLSVQGAAELLDLAPEYLALVLDGKISLSQHVANRLEKAGWSTAESWLRSQQAYDLYEVKARGLQ